MNFFKKSAALALGLFLIAGSVFAQGQQMNSAQADKVSDEELKEFVDVVKGFQQINLESQKDIQAVLADKDINMMRLKKIMMSKRNPQMADSIQVTAKEEELVKEITPKLTEIQRKSQKQRMSVIKESDLNPQRFQVIQQSLRSDTTLAKRFQKIAQDSMQK